MAIDDPPLPPGSVVNGQLLVTSYFDQEGAMKYIVGVNGDLNIAQALGLLVLSGISVFRQYEQDNPYPPDDLEDFIDDDEEDDEDD